MRHHEKTCEYGLVEFASLCVLRISDKGTPVKIAVLICLQCVSPSSAMVMMNYEVFTKILSVHSQIMQDDDEKPKAAKAIAEAIFEFGRVQK